MDPVKADVSLRMLMALLLAGQVSGCVGVVIGAGATAGVAASEERGMSGSLEDTKIRAGINDAWFRHDVDMFRKVTLTITEGRVLLTGVVPSDKVKEDAARLTWQVAGVREVYNEILVMPDGANTVDSGRDVWIQQQIKAKLLFDKEIRNINYTVDVTDGTVYLMGIAQSDTELNRVIAYAREVSYVRNVVNYVLSKGDARRTGG